MSGKNLTIAIDGHSSTGKSTLAKGLAKHFGFIYVDTGAMYRAITLAALRKGLLSDPERFGKDASEVEQLLKETTISFYRDAHGANRTKLNGSDVEDEIRAMEVSSRVSYVSAVSAIRKALVDQQRRMSEGESVVMDGRDIGTVVFPNADLKIFMSASNEVRAQRRFEELTSKGKKVTFEEVLENLTERDRIDSSRADSPLVMAEDAVLLDNSSMSQAEQFELAKSWIEALVK
ncbi:(d)CMP kinase [Phaeocystidibacter luteus]|uniref:Cytidylate kinase n=1 Tax=Phaeocystidibacter luteus TaxID=911197 RepID=A0A6N6RJ69_9FLAO|nr:(d)CMP kinase [Phaeocystidibacter luteus]KAB2806800.1 (d)CMP kinase [Phaeocystidibacter luteus]